MPEATSINIRPGVGVLGLFSHMNYRPWYAIAELVDNALASYLANRARLDQEADYKFRVVIEIDNVDGGSLRVWDNAAGISSTDYERAFVTADPPPDTSGLSQFGIGMKSASCWFAQRWLVRTSALDEAVERTVEFDVPRIVRDGVEELFTEETTAPRESHFTELRLWDLNRPLQRRTLGKMKDHLASMYRVFLRRGDMSLTFNGEELAYADPEILEVKRANSEDDAPITWKKEVGFSLATGESVVGYAAIRKTASTSKAGFALFRNERLVVGSDDETYRPQEIFGGPNTFRYQRIFGELHLTGFEVSHTKDGFIWGEREGDFLAALRASLEDEQVPLLWQAENHRARQPSEGARSSAAEAVAATADAVASTAQVIEGQIDREPESGPLPSSIPPTTAAATRTVQFAIREQSWEVTIELTTDESVTDWVTLSDQPSAARHPGDQRRVEIRVSLTHPFMLQFVGPSSESVEPLLRVAAAVAVAEVTAREAGVRRAGTLRRNINELLRTLARRQGGRGSINER